MIQMKLGLPHPDEDIVRKNDPLDSVFWWPFGNLLGLIRPFDHGR